MVVENGRQVSPTIDGIRDDHRKRYKFASDIFANMTVIDAACGVGYGSKLLTEKGCKVFAYDVDPEAIAYLRWHYRDPNVTAKVGDVQKIKFEMTDAAISFETIEHLDDPKTFLNNLRLSTSLLIGSVPNQNVIPFDSNRHLYHKRHYTHNEISDLLNDTGWKIEYMWGQVGKMGYDAEVTRNPNCSTIIFGATAYNAKFPKVSI